MKRVPNLEKEQLRALKKKQTKKPPSNEYPSQMFLELFRLKILFWNVGRTKNI